VSVALSAEDAVNGNFYLKAGYLHFIISLRDDGEADVSFILLAPFVQLGFIIALSLTDGIKVSLSLENIVSHVTVASPIPFV